jgi:hypothetical protein
LKKYRRIEVNAFRRRVTIVSGEWPRDICDEQPAQTDDGVSLNDADLCEPVEPDSPEGQLILVEAVCLLGIGPPPARPKYIWKVEKDLAEQARRFIDTFNTLFGEKLPSPEPAEAEPYWHATKAM